MPVHRHFPARVTASQILEIANSLGAHIASKLQSLGSDERTLTDELCDMFLIWSQQPPPPQPTEVLLPVTFYKSTQAEEAATGFDLLVRIIGPDGRFKQAFLQAKVFNPDTHQFRHDDPAGWSKLRNQLLLMRALADNDMYFLLVYVPALILDDSRYNYSTWEQDFCNVKLAGASESRFGATAISGSDLLSAKNRWLKRTKCEHVSNGEFKPAGISFARLLVDMILCNRGDWSKAPLLPEGKRQWDEPSAGGPRVVLTIGFEPRTLADGWPQFLESLKGLSKSGFK